MGSTHLCAGLSLRACVACTKCFSHYICTGLCCLITCVLFAIWVIISKSRRFYSWDKVMCHGTTKCLLVGHFKKFWGWEDTAQNAKVAVCCHEKCMGFFGHGSHFFTLINFRGISSIFTVIQYFFTVLFHLKYAAILAGFSLWLADKFPWSVFFSIFQYNFSSFFQYFG